MNFDLAGNVGNCGKCVCVFHSKFISSKKKFNRFTKCNRLYNKQITRKKKQNKE